LADLELTIKKYIKTASKYYTVCKRFSSQLIDNYQVNNYNLCYVNIKIKNWKSFQSKNMNICQDY